MSVQISIIHFAEDHEINFNDFIVEQVKSIRFFTKHPYHLNIIDNQMSLKARKDLDDKLPDVEILRTSGRYNTFPAGVNHAIENMRGDYMFVSHTDMLMGWNWLDCLMLNLQSDEIKEGFPCATCPTLIFYPEKKSDIINLVDETRRNGVQNYMEKHRIPYKMWDDRPIAVSRPGEVTDNGWRLGGAYIASKRFFDEVGLYDPIINRMNDKSYGIRALMTDCRVSHSNRVYLHHFSGLHTGGSGVYGIEYFAKQLPKDRIRPDLGTYAQFKLEWGTKIFKKVQDGTIWIELHEIQRKGGGVATRKMIERYKSEGGVYEL